MTGAWWIDPDDRPTRAELEFEAYLDGLAAADRESFELHYADEIAGIPTSDDRTA